MNLPSPALVTRDAARRLPRWALLLLCLAYVLPGFVGRDVWKSAELLAFGRMLALTESEPGIWHTLPVWGDAPALLPHWLGAGAILALAPLGVSAELASCLPFVLMLAGTLAATWHAVYHLARLPGAQPVAFAFGGEAPPADYARALADGGLLALLATLGLAQLSHETTPASAQLFFTSLMFYGLAALPRPGRGGKGAIATALGSLGLAMSGAPWLALAYITFGCFSLSGISAAVTPPPHWATPQPEHVPRATWDVRQMVIFLGTLALLCWGLSLGLDLLHPPADAWRNSWSGWASLARLLAWFTWPAWPLVLWTLWRWRKQLPALRQHRHLGLPLLMAGMPLLVASITQTGDKALVLALPALAALAALALPTFSRAGSALIDWFTVLFFTGWAVVIWVVWVSLQTGIPAKPAANVAKLAPGFESLLQWPAFLVAVSGTLAWIALARWRTGRHRTALWKSLVLPATGTTLCWLLLMTLWLPALNYGRSYAPQIAQIHRLTGEANCVYAQGLSAMQIVALQHHGGWPIQPLSNQQTNCEWLIIQAGDPSQKGKPSRSPASTPPKGWHPIARVPRPTDESESLLLLHRSGSP